jgi:hypothetical protein
MFKSIKAIFAGFVIFIGTMMLFSTVAAFIISPIFGRLSPIASSIGWYLFLAVAVVSNGLLTGHFISVIAGRREIMHTSAFLGIFLSWAIIPSMAMMKNWGEFVKPTQVYQSIGAAFVVAIFSLIAAFRVSRNRAQQCGPADAGTARAADL